MSLTAESITVEAEQHKDTMIHLAASVKNVRYEIIKSPKHGSYALDPATGHFQYRSEKEFHGVDTMTYIVTTKDGEESTPADVVIKVFTNDEKQEVVELTLEIPAHPDVDDCLDAIDTLMTELTELIHGDDDEDDDD